MRDKIASSVIAHARHDYQSPSRFMSGGRVSVLVFRLGQLPHWGGSGRVDAGTDLELAVAFHLADRAGTPNELPVQDRDFVIEDPWGRS